MSARHPIIAVTGSSGAGTSTISRTFGHIFRREGIRAACVEGDAFHRYSRSEMQEQILAAEARGEVPPMPFMQFHGRRVGRRRVEMAAAPVAQACGRKVIE